MKFKNILLMLALLSVFFVGCSRQARVIPQVTPQKTASETPSVVPGTQYPDTTVRQGTATGVGTDTGAKMGTTTGVGTDTGAKMGTTTGVGTDTGAKMGTATGVGTDTGAKTGAAIGKDTGNKVGTGTKTESKVGTGGSLEHGTYNGDLYVSTKNFRLIDTKVNGNVYFTTNEAKSTFTMDATSKVTGRQELKK
jgi:hypothetical protein